MKLNSKELYTIQIALMARREKVNEILERPKNYRLDDNGIKEKEAELGMIKSLLKRMYAEEDF